MNFQASAECAGESTFTADHMEARLKGASCHKALATMHMHKKEGKTRHSCYHERILGKGTGATVYELPLEWDVCTVKAGAHRGRDSLGVAAENDRETGFETLERSDLHSPREAPYAVCFLVCCPHPADTKSFSQDTPTLPPFKYSTQSCFRTFDT